MSQKEKSAAYQLQLKKLQKAIKKAKRTMPPDVYAREIAPYEAEAFRNRRANP